MQQINCVSSRSTVLLVIVRRRCRRWLRSERRYAKYLELCVLLSAFCVCDCGLHHCVCVVGDAIESRYIGHGEVLNVRVVSILTAGPTHHTCVGIHEWNAYAGIEETFKTRQLLVQGMLHHVGVFTLTGLSVGIMYAVTLPRDVLPGDWRYSCFAIILVRFCCQSMALFVCMCKCVYLCMCVYMCVSV